jgi:uncharacterized phage-associated protein
VYSFFKVFKGNPITVPAMRAIPTSDGTSVWEPYSMPEDRQVREFLEEVYSKYKQYSATKLSNASHVLGSPWADVTDNGKNTGARPPIPNNVIKQYFDAHLPKNRGGHIN